MATSGGADASDIKVRSSGVCLLNCFVCIACIGLLDRSALTAYEHIPLTWGVSSPVRRWVAYESGLAMNAMPGESRTSASLVLHLICSAEKLPSIMKVRMS